MAGSSSSSSAPNRSELWRQAKRKRAAEWAAFNASRPDDTFDAPEDVAALQHAAATVGDFKLKSNPGFTLPDVSTPGAGG
jgi:predicted RNA-binding Zn ribbon-like protein